MSRSFHRPAWSISIAIGLAAVGFVGAAQWNSSVARQAFTTSAQQVLTRQVLDLQAEQQILREQIESVEDEVLVFQQETEGSQTALSQLNQRLAEARLASGLTRVAGPGVIVEIADSNRIVPQDGNAQNFIVLVDDLRDIVTALWASGAEAITINGERLVATSSIYGVGASVLVNTAFLSPPFRMEAIGPDGILDRFLQHEAFRGRVQQRIEAYGLEFAAAPAESLDLRPFIGNTRLRWGAPTEGPG